MTEFNTIGLIVNPTAGRGKEQNIDLARQVIVKFGFCKVFTGVGPAGEYALINLPCDMTIIHSKWKASRNLTLDLARKLAILALDAVVVVGGDGTLADVAFIFSQFDHSPPLLGVGAGSTNAGALITINASQLAFLAPLKLKVVYSNALLAHVDGVIVGAGFNDCVLGFTSVATVNGRLRDVDVKKKCIGKNFPSKPSSIGLSQTSVTRSGPSGLRTIASGESIATVIVGFAESSFIAKAITGGICLTAFSRLQAGCLVSDLPLVQVELTPHDVLQLPAIHSSFISLSEKDRIVVSGVREGSGLCVDGTPLRILHADQEVSFSLLPDAVRVYKTDNENKGEQ